MLTRNKQVRTGWRPILKMMRATMISTQLTGSISMKRNRVLLSASEDHG